MRISELEAAVGGLSRPSKMPGYAYGIPATKCKVGSLLRKIQGSVCSKCYAQKGLYSLSNVKRAQNRRLAILRANLSAWTDNMIALLDFKYRNKSGDDAVFRWHDSGDLQSMDHLLAIVKIAKKLPTIRFWMPTKEYGLIRAYVVKQKGRIWPKNLVVRVSAPMIGEQAAPIRGTVTSTSGTNKGYRCPAPNQGNNCADCRACWNRSIKNIDYKMH